MTILTLRLRVPDGTATPLLHPRTEAAKILDRHPEALHHVLIGAEWDAPPRPTRAQLRAAIHAAGLSNAASGAAADAVLPLIHGDPTPDLSTPEET